MCNRVNLSDLDNSTLDSIYNFYFEFDDSTAIEKPESQQLSNITCVVVILALIFFIIILLLVIRKLTKGRETSLDDAIMMNRIEGLRNQMNESVFNLFTGKFSI